MFTSILFAAVTLLPALATAFGINAPNLDSRDEVAAVSESSGLWDSLVSGLGM
jgi:hypothetical protein